jgi:hypothetical protein
MKVRKQKELLPIVLVLCFCTSCSKKDSQSNPPAAKNEIVLKAPFDKAGDFSCGLGLVQMGQWVRTHDQVQQCYIDHSGRVLLTPNFDRPFSVSSFSEDLALIHSGFTDRTCRSGGRWGYINKSGKIAIRPQFDYAFPFSDGMARVRKGPWHTGKYGFVDKKGKLVIPYHYLDAREFKEGLAAVCFGGRYDGSYIVAGKWGFIDKAGKVVIAPRFDYAEDFSEGLSKVRFGKKWGYIDQRGDVVVEPRFDGYLGRFSEGLAKFAVCKQVRGLAYPVKWGYIDRTGAIIIEPQFNEVGNFSEGLAWVMRGEPEKGDCCEYIDRKGNVAIKTRFQLAKDFSEGLAAVAIGVLWETGKPLDTTWGYIDKSGKIVIPPQYDAAESFSEGIAVVDCSISECKYKYIDRTGKDIIANEH